MLNMTITLINIIVIINELHPSARTTVLTDDLQCAYVIKKARKNPLKSISYFGLYLFSLHCTG